MTRGPRPTTNRGRRAGGRELRAWVSADEFEAVTRAAEAAGVTREQFIRDAALGSAASVASMTQELANLRTLGASIHKAVAAALEARAKEVANDRAFGSGNELRARLAARDGWAGGLREAARIVRGA